MPSIGIFDLLFGAVRLMRTLEGYPLKWVASLNDVPCELIGLAWKYDRPQHHWQVRFKDPDGAEHVIHALHDLDGKPVDALAMDGMPLPNGDMDIMPRIFSGLLILQFEWREDGAVKKNRLRLTTDLHDDPNGIKLMEWIEGT